MNKFLAYHSAVAAALSVPLMLVTLFGLPFLILLAMMATLPLRGF